MLKILLISMSKISMLKILLISMSKISMLKILMISKILVMEIPTRFQYSSIALRSSAGVGFLGLPWLLQSFVSVDSNASVEVVKEVKEPSNEGKLDAKSEDPRNGVLLSAVESSEPVKDPRG